MTLRKEASLLATIIWGIAMGSQAQPGAKPKVDPTLPDPAFDIRPEEAAENQHYRQAYRPQFHYTPIQGFVGDATGLIRSGGVYHLFYMSDKWERRKNRNKRWGYATSRDLLHWEEQPSVLDPVKDNKPGSGSGLVDWNNTLNLQTGQEKTLVVFYTDYKRGSCILYSTDAGRTWIRHPRNPVLPAIAKSDRDPTVFWYEPGRHFVMVRHEEPFDNGSGKTGFAFFTSANLLDWTFQSRIGDFNECPDLFELPVEGGSSGEKKWVLVDASFSYRVGSFNGQRFDPETEKLRADFGASKYAYAPQSWKPAPSRETFPIQMGFLTFPKGDPAHLTWHGQMSFPCELHLKQLAEGTRLCREPIKALESLHGEGKAWQNLSVRPGDNPLAGLTDDTLDLQADIDLGGAQAVQFGVRGETVRYSVAEKKLEVAGIKAPLRLSGSRLRIRILVDRSSIEVFADEGQVSASRVVFFDAAKRDVSLRSEGGDVQVSSLVVYPVKSIWK